MPHLPLILLVRLPLQVLRVLPFVIRTLLLFEDVADHAVGILLGVAPPALFRSHLVHLHLSVQSLLHFERH